MTRFFATIAAAFVALALALPTVATAGDLPRPVERQIPGQFELIGHGALPSWAKGSKIGVGPTKKFRDKFTLRWNFSTNGTATYTNVTKYSSGNVYKSNWVLVRDKPSGAVGVATYVKVGKDYHARIFFRGGLQVAPTSQVSTTWNWRGG